MAGMDLRGKETDVIMWDSSMTEKPVSYFTFFMKQALISGKSAECLFTKDRMMYLFRLTSYFNRKSSSIYDRVFLSHERL
jgi:hypothetical protein